MWAPERALAALQRRLLALTEDGRWSLVQRNGQRRLRRVPPAPPAPRGAELFLAHLPRDCFEDELVPLCRRVAEIHEFRLMMDFSGSNRGYAFVSYNTVEDAHRAIRELNGCEIRPMHRISVMRSLDNRRLYLGGIPRHLTRQEVIGCLQGVEGLKDVIMYSNYGNIKENRGFAFLEFESHRMASLGRRMICASRMPDLGKELKVDWADPEPEVEDDIMRLVKVLYIRNLLLKTSPAYIRNRVEDAVGVKIVRVKKINDYAFVHFFKRSHAEKALQKLQSAKFDGSKIEIKWSKPVDRNHYAKFKENRNSKCLAKTLAHYQKHEHKFLESTSMENHSSGYLGSGSDTSGSNYSNHSHSALVNSYSVNENMLAPGKLNAICKQYDWPPPKYQFKKSEQTNYWTGFVCFVYINIGLPLLSSITPLKPLVSSPCATMPEAQAMAAQLALTTIWNLRNSLRGVPVNVSYAPPTLVFPAVTPSSAYLPHQPSPPAYSVPLPRFWPHGLCRE